ncbi:MAG: thiamine phosphate synthase [Xanthobacteraceae bacterium]|nr:thiamine phosphate synthase [Xanthobacteraceae bacterium]
MARQPQPDKRPAPRLYLVTPRLGETNAFARELGEAVRAADIAAVLLRLKGAGEREMVNRVKALASVVQETGAALVLDGQPDIAARAGADGAHLTGVAAFTAAVEGLKPARIAGCGGLHTRDDAMMAGENGADYVMFGEPEAEGRRPSLPAIIDRVEWWAEVFEIPCVGFAATLDEVGPLAAAGADFVALGESIWDDPRGPAAAVADAATRLGVPEPAQ